MSCLLTWEPEVLSVAAYLVTIRGPIMVVVYSCGAPTAVGRKELLQFVILSSSPLTRKL